MHIGQGADISRRLQNAWWTDSTHQTKVFPDKQAAALVMQPLMQKYNIQPDGGIEAQTVATDRAFVALRLMLNAQAITAADNYSYVELIKSIQDTLKYYRQISDDHRRTNRRVSVKSDVVGNHTYATVSGWTWELISLNFIDYEIIFNPMIDAMSVVKKNSRQNVAGSWKMKMPMTTAPTAPIPVHTG